MTLEMIGIGLLIEHGWDIYTHLPFGDTEFNLEKC